MLNTSVEPTNDKWNITASSEDGFIQLIIIDPYSERRSTIEYDGTASLEGTAMYILCIRLYQIITRTNAGIPITYGVFRPTGILKTHVIVSV